MPRRRPPSMLSMRTTGSPYGDRPSGSDFFGGIASIGTRPPSRTSCPEPPSGRMRARGCAGDTARGAPRLPPRSSKAVGGNRGRYTDPITAFPCARPLMTPSHRARGAQRERVRRSSHTAHGTVWRRWSGRRRAGLSDALRLRLLQCPAGFSGVASSFWGARGCFLGLPVVLGTSRGTFWAGQRLDDRQAPQKQTTLPTFDAIPTSARCASTRRRSRHAMFGVGGQIIGRGDDRRAGAGGGSGAAHGRFPVMTTTWASGRRARPRSRQPPTAPPRPHSPRHGIGSKGAARSP